MDLNKSAQIINAHHKVNTAMQPLPGPRNKISADPQKPDLSSPHFQYLIFKVLEDVYCKQ